MKKDIFALGRISVLIAVIVVLVGIAACSALAPSTDIPPPSTGETATGENVSALPKSTGITPTTSTKMVVIGGQLPEVDWLDMTPGSRLWTLYNGAWTMGNAALYAGDWTYLLLYNDRNQWISIYEIDPKGWKDWNPLGHQSAGYYYHQFKAEDVGWNHIYADGTSTGQSNTVWIYVWPTTPPEQPLTVNAWEGSSYYTLYPPSTVYTYYTVNKPCYVRATYLKQGGGMARYGPRYVSAGTHTDTGTIGPPTGMRTVVVDAWTRSGEYAYDITSYNVG